ncbi:DUF6171 family protein [Streptococcus gallolyticus]|uniref:DUF6171 family protein n=1 Tax=Streptococcus gallolyticus TaxID=315405 RepID=UPI00211BEE06|nr:DUF6171 family protein [Streptococcus gallolyticus]MCQ9216454.1 DUF6171 family protein [Streptococcus gallolyticus]
MVKKCFGCAAKVTLSDQEIEESIAEQLALEFNLVTDDEWYRRQIICETCPQRVGPTCGKCGCYYKFRTALAIKTCPEEKW